VTFTSPAFLALLALVPLGVLAWWLLRNRRRRYAIRFPATASVAAVLQPRSAWRRVLPAALMGLAVAALAFALARPHVTVDVPIEQASVVLISDTSGSMAATDVSPTRLDAARHAALTFLDRVPKQLRVGLVAFSDSPHTVLRPTLDRNAIGATIESLDASGATATGDALNTALGNVTLIDSKKRHPPAAIVLLSDGKTTAGSDPLEAAREAARLKIPVYTVALGTPDGVVPGGFNGYIPVPPDPETLREIARISKGQAFTAEDADELDGIYEKLGRQVGTKPEEREVTAGFAGAGFLLLLAAASTGFWFRGRVA
jgi:Ca-activated chloride channel family protein